ncbi:hypothetical protein [Sphingomonas cavernae]|uniref:Secreted protein n=1 Tax=Sphingomonas cavernae TaxID=2320861 RepID=A0A418WPL8_9SPHN|nr:hypothetical protein [Sphingomonas cavernae]RJF93175.1 hypothetical protein D3876_02085 [Sphingomonas cavernae]
MRYGCHLAVVIALVGSPPTGVAAETDARPKSDPGEIICRSEPVLGSRLAKRRYCLTRAQWDERRASDRQIIEKSQLIPCLPTRGSNC